MKRTDRDVMLAPLSDNILDKTIGFRAADGNSKIDSASSFIKQRLSKRDGASVTQDIKWPFIWAKEQLSSKKKVKKRGSKKVRLSAGQKKLLGLNKIGRKSLNFMDFTTIHQCWIQYMMDYFKIPDLEEKGLDGVEHVSWDEFSVQLWKADLHGAFVKVIRSTCPVFVGLEGYIIFESKNTYKVLGEDNITRCVPKQSCEFRMKIKDYELSFLGKNMLLKPNERSNKKPKNFSYSDL